MSTRTESQKWLATNVTLGDGTGGTVATSDTIIKMRGRRGMALQWQWLSTLVAGFKLYTTADYDDRRPTDAVWTEVTDPNIVSYLTTDYTVPSGLGGKPAGTAGNGFLQIDPLQADAIKLTTTRTSSSGGFKVWSKSE
jgi:hypothetical protein